MTSNGKRIAPPKASAMIEALRGLGYNTATALADIIDNSIAADAENIWITFDWHGEKSKITILDDGVGMSKAELDIAMRLGEKNPLSNRAENDLGRFGLGLKTAAFSQCRRLTVATIGSDGWDCLRWDLDDLGVDGNSWYLHEGAHSDSGDFSVKLKEQKSGTMVLWENLDRIITKGYQAQDFLDLCDHVEKHLAMVFHRYLERKKTKINIYINDKKVLPWDPFLEGNISKPWVSPEAKAPGNPDIKVQCHVLPHKDRMSEKSYLNAQGPDGWTAQQGFYVYRNERLLLAGSWLGLGQGRSWTKDEAHRLARIRLDIPNSSDTEWKIDIRKSTARPPLELRPWLVRLAEETRVRARRAFAHRGKPAKNSDKYIRQAWKTEHSATGIRYKIDTEHVAIKNALEQAGPLLADIQAMLRVIEETVPIQRIWLDTAENHETPQSSFDTTPTEEMVEFLKILFKRMTGPQGMSDELACEHLLNQEPFNNYPELVKSLPLVVNN